MGATYRRMTQPKKLHPKCPFCERTFKVTPRKIAGKAKELVAEYRDHLLACSEKHCGFDWEDKEAIAPMLDAMAEYARAVEREW